MDELYNTDELYDKITFNVDGDKKNYPDTIKEILIATSEKRHEQLYHLLFQEYNLQIAPTTAALMTCASQQKYDLIFIDMYLANGVKKLSPTEEVSFNLETIKEINSVQHNVPIVIYAEPLLHGLSTDFLSQNFFSTKEGGYYFDLFSNQLLPSQLLNYSIHLFSEHSR